MRPPLPRYFDPLLVAYPAGQVGRDVHLGFWDHPPPDHAPCTPAAFAAAQARLTERMVDLAQPRPGTRILDIGCGFGGTLQEIGRRVRGAALLGLNIDRRQLQICRGLPAGEDNRLSLIEADACALPLETASLDTVICVEAMFHFRTRAGFFAEVARVLHPGGRLALSDLLARHPQHAAPWRAAVMEHALRVEYGPWPDIWVSQEDVLHMARQAGLVAAIVQDWSEATLPSYRFTAPPAGATPSPQPGAGEVMRWLHANGWLRYVATSFRRT